MMAEGTTSPATGGAGADLSPISELTPQPVVDFADAPAALDADQAEPAGSPVFTGGDATGDLFAAAPDVDTRTPEEIQAEDEEFLAAAAAAAAASSAVAAAASVSAGAETAAGDMAPRDGDQAPDASPSARAHFADAPAPNEPEAAPVARDDDALFSDSAIHGSARPVDGAGPAAPQASAQAPGAEDPITMLPGMHPALPEDEPVEPEPRPSAPAPRAVPDPAAPEDTAEIDVVQVEAKLSDPGSTQSFAPVTDDRIETDSTYDAGTTTSLMWGARSDVGCVRNHNEDSYLVASPLFAVCDGMGGHAAGEVASAIAVETIAAAAPDTADPALLAAAVEAANTAVIEAAVNGVGRPGMGCTATAAYIEGTTVAIAHAGDSRAYLLHEGTLIRITRDHSYVEELVDAGEITADEARVHPNRSVITRALGSDPAMYADHFSLNIEEGDRLILCSDGLSSMIPDNDIEDIAVQSATPQMCTDNLVDAALAAGGGDNVTVIVVDVVDDGRMADLARRRRRNFLVGAGTILAVLLIAVAWMAHSVAGSIYLGCDGDTVAVYRGSPVSAFGFELSSLEESTSIELADLPEDTQARLEEGIPQASLDEARDTLSAYRSQIDEQQAELAANAATIRSGTEAEAADADAAAAADAGAGTDGTASPDTPDTPEGGA